MHGAISSALPSHIRRVVIDNGGYTCKVGFAGEFQPVRTVPNAVARTNGQNHKVYVADQIEALGSQSGLQYRLCLERGCLVNWDSQAEVWGRLFGPQLLNVNPCDSSLTLSEAPMVPTAIQDTLDEMVFEHFGFHSYVTRPAPVFAAIALQDAQAPKCAALVIDAGFSATHCVPIFGGAMLNFGLKRLNVGGKFLTNQLKQVISFRSYNVMDEHRIVNDIKERLCQVSLNFETDIALSRFMGRKNTLKREFVLPDFVNRFCGMVRNPSVMTTLDATAPATTREKDDARLKKKEKPQDEQVQKISLTPTQPTIPLLPSSRAHHTCAHFIPNKFS